MNSEVFKQSYSINNEMLTNDEYLSMVQNLLLKRFAEEITKIIIDKEPHIFRLMQKETSVDIEIHYTTIEQGLEHREIIYCKDCAKFNKVDIGDFIVECGKKRIAWKPDSCPLIKYRGYAKGHEYDYGFCSLAERRKDDEGKENETD